MSYDELWAGMDLRFLARSKWPLFGIVTEVLGCKIVGSFRSCLSTWSSSIWNRRLVTFWHILAAESSELLRGYSLKCFRHVSMCLDAAFFEVGLVGRKSAAQMWILRVRSLSRLVAESLKSFELLVQRRILTTWEISNILSWEDHTSECITANRSKGGTGLEMVSFGPIIWDLWWQCYLCPFVKGDGGYFAPGRWGPIRYLKRSQVNRRFEALAPTFIYIFIVCLVRIYSKVRLFN